MRRPSWSDALLFMLQDFGEVGSNGQADAVARRIQRMVAERAERREAIEARVGEVNGRESGNSPAFHRV